MNKKVNVLWIGYSTDTFNRVPFLQKSNLNIRLLMTKQEKENLSEYISIDKINIRVIKKVPFNSLAYSFEAFNAVKKDKASLDVIISDFFYFIGAALIKLIKKNKPKLILDILSPPIADRGLKSVLNNLFYKFNLSIAKYYGDLIIVLNEPMKEYTNKFIKNKNKILVCQPGVKLDFYDYNLQGKKKELLKKISFDKKEAILMYHGSVSYDRGFDLLIDSFKLINNRLPTTGLIILGSGNYLNLLKNKVKEYGLEKEVYFFGQFNHDDLKKFLNVADICISPQPDHPIHNVNNPYKVIESLAAKKAVIATNTPPHRHINRGNVLQLVNCNPKSMSEGIEYLMKNPKLRKKMGERGYEFVKKNYNWDKSNEKMYKGILKLFKNETIK